MCAEKFIGVYHPYPKEEPTWSSNEKITYLKNEINEKKRAKNKKKSRLFKNIKKLLKKN